MLNCPGGPDPSAPTDPALLASLKAEGFDQVRIDIQDYSLEHGRARAQDVLDAGLQPLCIINDGEQMRGMPAGVLYDFGNEPNLNKDGRWPTWRDYERACADAVTIARELNRATAGLPDRLYVGSISNLDRKALNYLRHLPIREWARAFEGLGVSPHRYPVSYSPPETPQRGSRSRDEEMQHLFEITGVVPTVIGEIGYNSQEFNEEECAANMAWERQFFSAHGVEIVGGYQVNDGPDPTEVEHCYGWRRGDTLEWKPVVRAFIDAGSADFA